MCGISGFVDFNGHSPDTARIRIVAMTNLLTHRGPDEDGFYVDDRAALGHRRLSIVDIAGGQQPMSVLNGEVQIVFNGEIYNFREIRSQLQSTGIQFRTSSDTEVILQSYLQWGDRCVDRLNGMFAFAIWDKRSGLLTLARDRVGKKPLYIYQSGTVVAFASELKSLRVGNTLVGEIDPESLDCYLSMGYVPAPRTIYRGVQKLRPAHVLTLSRENRSERKYWHLEFGPYRNISESDAVDEFEEILDEAVRCRLVSEVPLGAFLSGGIDSSLVVSSMSRILGDKVKTHTIGFDESEFSESESAREIASFLNTDHKEFTVHSDASNVLEKIAWHFDEPFADSSALPTWYVCKMTRQSVTVALSGDGGDEAFGGYTFRYWPHVMECGIRRRISPAIRSAVFGSLGAVWPASARLPKALRLKTIFENLATSDVQAFYRDMTWLRQDHRDRLYRKDFAQSLKGFTPFETVEPYYSKSGAPDALGRSQHADTCVYMTDDVLAKVDRMSMAHSLEIRSPLLDHRVLEFAARLPAPLRMKSREGKVLLRRLAARRLPEKVQSMPKRGFSIPAAAWLRGDLREMVEQLVLQNRGVVAEAIDIAVLRTLWKEHLNCSRDHSVFFWSLMMLGLWGNANSDLRLLRQKNLA